MLYLLTKSILLNFNFFQGGENGEGELDEEEEEEDDQ